MTVLVLLILLFVPSSLLAGTTIIPAPLSVQERGGSFLLTEKTRITPVVPELAPIAQYLSARLEMPHGLTIPVAEDGAVVLQYTDDHNLGEEGYVLEVRPESVLITGRTGAGVFYGVQTFLQLVTDSHAVRSVSVLDEPRFAWRGMHLDVCRHFFPVEFIRKYIDLLAMYKMNRFHWHLTDDQGWRIEIKRYPELTEVGGWRSGSMIGHHSEQRFDSIRYGGYYTQEEIRGIVRYAAERNVTVIPEIEMPGHSTAALAAFPGLSCTGGPFEVGQSWGVYEDVFCPKEETFDVLENVLAEVCDLFPGPYIHIGGDETLKTRWAECSHCQALIVREGLEDEHELQSYFIRRIERFLDARGKKLIGWDEILEGGLSPNATVMSWRGTEGGIAAAREGHDAVMSPGSHCYFDHYQGNPRYEPLAIGGYTPLEKVYAYEPVPEELTPAQSRHILGAQGNVWTEYITTPEHVEYMAVPRLLALSEVLWSSKKERDFAEFARRAGHHFHVLDRLGVNYSRSMFQVSVKTRVNGEQSALHCTLSNSGTGKIRFTTDGSEPTKDGNLYDQPFPVPRSILVKAASFSSEEKLGPTTDQVISVSKSTGREIAVRQLPDRGYGDGDVQRLVDGIRGDPSRFGMDWLGFRGTDLDVVIDLGHADSVRSVGISFVDAEASWIYLPKEMTLRVSSDGTNSLEEVSFTEEEIRRSAPSLHIALPRVMARYIHLFVRNAGVIPEGKPGAGNGAWLFVDEIIVE